MKILTNKEIKVITNNGKSWLWDTKNQRLVKRKCDTCSANRSDVCALSQVRDCIGCRRYLKANIGESQEKRGDR